MATAVPLLREKVEQPKWPSVGACHFFVFAFFKISLSLWIWWGECGRGPQDWDQHGPEAQAGPVPL